MGARVGDLSTSQLSKQQGEARTEEGIVIVTGGEEGRGLSFDETN